MKQLLFALLLLPFYCHAQLEVGLNYGITPVYKAAVDIQKGSKKSSIYDVPVSYRTHLFKFGIGYSFNTIKYAQQPQYLNYGSGTLTQHSTVTYNDIYFFIDHEMHIGRSFWSAGISGGYATGKDDASSSEVSMPYGTNTSNLFIFHTDCYTLGVHVGYSYQLFKGLCANANAGFNFPVSSADNLPLCSFTLGIHYKFSLAKQKPPQSPPVPAKQ